MEAFGKPELGRADAIKKIAPYIRDGEPFRLGMLEDCSNYFKENGYEVMEPCLEMENSKVKKQYSDIAKFFYGQSKALREKPESYQDTYCMIKRHLVKGKSQIVAGLCLAPMYIKGILVCYIDSIAVDKQFRLKGYGRQMLCHVKMFMRSLLGKKDMGSIIYMYIITQMSDISKPHEFYKKIGFNLDVLPQGFNSWNVVDEQMAYVLVQSSNETDEALSAMDLTDQRDQQRFRSILDNGLEYTKKQVGKESGKKSKAKVKTSKDSKVTTGKQSVQEEIIEASEVRSQVTSKSMATCKSKNGSINKHCLVVGCNGKIITGANWSHHCKKVHSMMTLQSDKDYVKCNGTDCLHCDNSQNGYSGGRKHRICNKCNFSKRSDGFENFIDFESPCKVCAKNIHSSISIGQLSEVNLKNLPIQSAQDNADYIELCAGDKRTYNQSCDNQQASVESPLKRIRLDESSPITNEYQFPAIEDTLSEVYDNVSQKSSTFKRPLDRVVVKENRAERLVAFTDINTVDILNQLEQDSKYKFECVQKVQEICEMFTQDVVIKFICQNELPNLASYLVEVQRRVDQLNDNQIIGIVIASINIGNECWTGAVRLLNQMDQDRRQSMLNKLQLFLSKQYTESVSKWCCQHWRHIEQQHLLVMKYVSSNSTEYDNDVLMLSLITVVPDHQRFVSFAISFIKTANISEMILKAITNRPSQQQMAYESFINLLVLMQNKSYAVTIESIKDTLDTVQIFRWAQQIEQSKATANIIDSESIQEFINTLSATYGDISKALQTDLTQTDDIRFELLLSTADKIPNARQFALAQYCVGKLYQCQRQLWVVPSGQGKSRIAATVAAIALMCEMFSKVHMVFENKHLLERDQKDFETYWQLLSYDDDMIQYHIGIDFKVGPNELVIIDEADALIFRQPDEFQKFTNDTACICFTATPDNQQVRGLEARVITALKFEKFLYVIDAAQEQSSLDFNKTIELGTVKEKALFIKDQVIMGPVLVYCNIQLADEIKAIGCPTLMADCNVDPEILRHLDTKVNNQYIVVIAMDQFGMRGIDYRSVDAVMALVVDKSFDNYREAVQGFNRVGRYEDSCTRIIFSDVKLIDKMAEVKQNAQLMKFVAEMVKKPLTLKPVNVKTAQTAKPKVAPARTAYVSQTLGEKRTQALIGQQTIAFKKTQ